MKHLSFKNLMLLCCCAVNQIFEFKKGNAGMRRMFDCDYKACLFDRFTVFIDEHGNLDIANNETELVFTNNDTGVNSKVNMDKFANLIKKVFPSRKEQKEILMQMM